MVFYTVFLGYEAMVAVLILLLLLLFFSYSLLRSLYLWFLESSRQSFSTVMLGTRVSFVRTVFCVFKGIATYRERNSSNFVRTVSVCKHTGF